MQFVAISLFLLCIGFSLLHIILTIISSNKMEIKKIDQKQIGISIIVPCYNEMKIVNTSILGITKLYYLNYNVFYINDGSNDRTLDVLKSTLDLKQINLSINNNLKYEKVINTYQSTIYDNVYVIDKKKGGKADSLNCGIDYAIDDIIVTLDADSYIDSDALIHINNTFKDENIVCGGGVVRILQHRNFENQSLKKCKYIIRMQILEYMKGFYVLRTSLSKLKAIQVISGAFGIFRKDILFLVGGFRNTIGEDIDITIRIQLLINKNKDKKIKYLMNAVAYTECPEKWGHLYKQRIRWQKAFIDTIVKFRKSLFKNIIRNSLAAMILFDSLLSGTISTFITIASYITLFFLPYEYFIFILPFFISSIVISIIYDILAIKLFSSYFPIKSKRSVFQLVVIILLDITIWRLINCFYIMLGSTLYFFNRHSWNKIERTDNVYKI